MKRLLFALLISSFASVSMAVSPAPISPDAASEQFILYRTCSYKIGGESAEAQIFVNPISRKGASGLIVFSASFLGRTKIASSASVAYYNSSRFLIREVSMGSKAVFVRLVLNQQQTEAILTVASENSQLRVLRATCE